jgi:hypothetical protein
MTKKKHTANIERLLELVQRDHGGCDQNSCTLGVALRHGYELVAIDNWIGCGASDKEFDAEAAKGLPFSFKQVQKQLQAMSREVNSVECPGCNGILWEPEWCDYHCDNCGCDIPKPGEKTG